MNKSSTKLSNKDSSNVIKQPRIWGFVILASLFVFIIILLILIFKPGLIYINKEDILIMVILLSSIIILFLLLISYFYTWEVRVYDDYFTYRSIFKTKRFYYNNIEVRHIGYSYKFFQDNKHITSISYLQDNFKLLVDTIEQYQKDNKIVVNKTVSNIIKPIMILWFPVILFLLLTVFVSMMLLIDYGLGDAFYISLPFNLLSLICFIYMINWKIEFNETSVIKTSLIRTKKTYKLNDVTYKVKQFFGNPEDIKLYYNNKVIARILGNSNNLSEIRKVLKNKDN